MHEFSIAQQITQVVFRTARENEAKLIERVVVVIGELTLLNEEQVRFWVEEVFSHKDISRGATLEIINRPALVRCSKCGFQGAPSCPGPEAHVLLPTLVCPHCGQPGMDIKEGRECLIQRITFQK
ncbi:hydrogenase maturation nickel metallochaperone HypA [bacterium]|nr:hydrogenase maturation nickel metallochaperone HypA [bacterium]